MSEQWIMAEKTKRTDGTERFEIHLGGVIHVISLEKGEKLARFMLSLLGIEVAQLEAELAGNALMDAEAESFIGGQELVPVGTLAELERLREELGFIAGRGITLDVKKYTGGDAVAMRILARAALKETVSHPTKQEGNDGAE